MRAQVTETGYHTNGSREYSREYYSGILYAYADVQAPFVFSSGVMWNTYSFLTLKDNTLGGDIALLIMIY